MREADAREPFRADASARALAPDALIHLHDQNGRGLLGFVELDMGTMSHARLKAKAAGYAAYAKEAAWAERHPFCPCLLFLTTTEARALAFLKLLHGLVDTHRRYAYRREGWLDWFAAGACAHAHEPERALAEACWDDLELTGGGLTLADCLANARAPYDTLRAKEDAELRAIETERARLLADPDARRAYLQEKRLYLRDEQLREFGQPGATALQLLLDCTTPMNEIEQAAFATLVRQLADDPLDAELALDPPLPTPRELDTVACLADRYRAIQQTRVEELSCQYGEGPSLHAYRRDLTAGGLLSEFSWKGIDDRAKLDRERRIEQERLRLAYLHRRERDARQRKHQTRLTARLAHGRAATYAIIDRDLLRICGSCNEVVYPPEQQRDRSGYLILSGRYEEPSRCHFCGVSDLDPWDPAYQAHLERGEMAVRAEGDLTFGQTAGSMDESDDEEGFDL
jgi:hypothetical protein